MGLQFGKSQETEATIIKEGSKPESYPVSEVSIIVEEQKKENKKLQKIVEKEYKEQVIDIPIWRDLVLTLLIVEQPRLSEYPHLLNIFLDILMFRLETKKNKVCMLRATINQINVGINITREVLHENGLDDYII